MIISNGVWPLNLSVDSLVLREIVPITTYYLLLASSSLPPPPSCVFASLSPGFNRQAARETWQGEFKNTLTPHTTQNPQKTKALCGCVASNKRPLLEAQNIHVNKFLPKYRQKFKRQFFRHFLIDFRMRGVRKHDKKYRKKYIWALHFFVFCL
jgi:hypothetical protein